MPNTTSESRKKQVQARISGIRSLAAALLRETTRGQFTEETRWLLRDLGIQAVVAGFETKVLLE
jgi:hypothetical protein